ncbi:MAG: ABC transporter permease [Nitrososphaerota archaeon]|nr:ABC transporter permease [Nitrososphaerota archaeon]MDG7023426.1 ABC transporter permease [Nitrososphaerota archaeon]
MASPWVYVIRRILFMIPVFLAVSVLVFYITNAAGNPIELVRQGIRNLTPAQQQFLINFYHVNDPVYVRYFLWLSDFVQGNLGQSLVLGGPVSALIGPWVLTTLELQLLSLFFSLALAIPIAVYSAKHPGSKGDATITTTAIFGFSIPVFWLGIILILIFSLDFRLLPSFGAISPYPPYIGGNIVFDNIAHLIMPVAVLTFASLAVFVRLLRANMVETLRSDYVLGARASGVSERSVTYRHALKNAVTPVVTIVGLTFALALGGAPATETTFSWPGLGYQFVQAASVLDLPVIQGITMIITIMALVANLITDLVYGVLDPRVRIE